MCANRSKSHDTFAFCISWFLLLFLAFWWPRYIFEKRRKLSQLDYSLSKSWDKTLHPMQNPRTTNYYYHLLLQLCATIMQTDHNGDKRRAEICASGPGGTNGDYPQVASRAWLWSATGPVSASRARGASTLRHRLQRRPRGTE